jgi:hypothetical protein
METTMDRRTFISTGLSALGATALSQPAIAQNQGGRNLYTSSELVQQGHTFFGGISATMAQAVEAAVKQWGEPQAYVIGQEGSGAFVFGLRYGEGSLRMRRGRTLPIYWQGPSVGFDAGGEGTRVMMLVYGLTDPQVMLRRFAGASGSAVVVAGVGIQAITADGVTIVPIRSGVGARRGANLSYLKFTDKPEWNPF